MIAQRGGDGEPVVAQLQRAIRDGKTDRGTAGVTGVGQMIDLIVQRIKHAIRPGGTKIEHVQGIVRIGIKHVRYSIAIAIQTRHFDDTTKVVIDRIVGPQPAAAHRDIIPVAGVGRLAGIPVGKGKRFATGPDIGVLLRLIIQTDPKIAIAAEVGIDPGIFDRVVQGRQMAAERTRLRFGAIPAHRSIADGVGVAVQRTDVAIQAIDVGRHVLVHVECEAVNEALIRGTGRGQCHRGNRRRSRIRNIQTEQILSKDSRNDLHRVIVRRHPRRNADQIGVVQIRREIE